MSGYKGWGDDDVVLGRARLLLLFAPGNETSWWDRTVAAAGYQTGNVETEPKELSKQVGRATHGGALT